MKKPTLFRLLAAALLSGMTGAAIACSSSSSSSNAPSPAPTTTPIPSTTDTAPAPSDAGVSTSDFVGCRKLLAEKPGTPSGVQAIDLDGTGPLPALQLYCDMTFEGGGWTLIQAYTGANTPADLLDASTSAGDSGVLVALPRPGTFGGLDGWVVKLLAEKSSQAHVRYSFAADASAADPDAGVWITSVPPDDGGVTLPIANLRKLRVFSDQSDGGFDAWAGPQATSEKLSYPFSCPGEANDLDYPSIYRACGNPSAMNIIAGLGGRVSWLWSNGGEKDPIEVYLR